MHDYLKAIIENKKDEVIKLKTTFHSEKILNAPKKSFKKALSGTSVSVIAEIKRKSPSKGHLAEIVDPVELAKKYVAGGAAAISILTDKFAFNGSIDDLQKVAHELRDVPVAILRKDFILDPLQITQAVAAGANAVLLIVTVLADKTKDLLQVAHSQGIDALVEVHNQKELDYAVKIGADIIGVNNRNLTTFEIDSNNALNLKPYIPDHVITVAESGINTLADAKRFAEAGFDAILIGEALVKADNPNDFIDNINRSS